MTDIPVTAIEFERWMADVSHEWPPELKTAGTRALLTIQSLDQPDVESSRAFVEASRKDLINFAITYAEWRAVSGKSR